MIHRPLVALPLFATLTLLTARAHSAAAPALTTQPGAVRTQNATATAAIPASVQHADASPLDRPMATAWPVANTWSDGIEREYSDFIERLGRAVSQRRCQHIDECIRSPEANSLYDAETDAHFALRVDCADLPYVLRAYFAFKRRLPFGFVSSVHGEGTDTRYMLHVTPDYWQTWQHFRTPRELLSQIGSMVHSGMYRTAPGVESADFYQIAMNRRAVHPGTIFYDPNGHVLVVAQVRTDGGVYLMDGHPDGSLTWKRFGEAFVTGTARLGGGFKNFRPLVWRNGTITRVANSALPLFDGSSQFDHALQTVNGQPATYHAWVRASLADANVAIDPVADFREQVRALCRDVTDRADAVNYSLAAGIQNRAHPDALPTNIYGTDGEWEQYSTPSRDARLKASFRELRASVASQSTSSALAPQLRTAWREETARPECRVSYVNSAGATVVLGMDTVLDRLFAMSFDPYDCPERRWGAPEGSAELASCRDDATKRQWYVSEQRLRNRIDRQYGTPTTLDFGPTESPDVDVRRVIASLAPEVPPAQLAMRRALPILVAAAPHLRVQLVAIHRPRTRVSFTPPAGYMRFGLALALCGLAFAMFTRRQRPPIEPRETVPPSTFV